MREWDQEERRRRAGWMGEWIEGEKRVKGVRERGRARSR